MQVNCIINYLENCRDLKQYKQTYRVASSWSLQKLLGSAHFVMDLLLFDFEGKK